MEADGDAVDDGRSAVQVAKVADVTRLRNGGGETDSGFGGGRRRFRLGDPGFAEDGPGELVDVFVGDIPEVRDECGTVQETPVSSGMRSRSAIRSDAPSAHHVVVRSSGRIKDPLLLQHAGRAAPEHRHSTLREVSNRLRADVLLGTTVTEVPAKGERSVGQPDVAGSGLVACRGRTEAGLGWSRRREPPPRAVHAQRRRSSRKP